MELARFPVHRALTRPQMFAGVTYSFFIINAAVTTGDHAALTTFAPGDEAAGAAINSAEHLLPLLYAVGARLPGDQVGVFNDTVDGALSMTSYLIGDPGLLTTIQ